MFDPRGSGRSDAGAVRTILEHVGAHGRLSEEDLKVAIGAASDGGGGGIGLPLKFVHSIIIRNNCLY